MNFQSKLNYAAVFSWLVYILNFNQAIASLHSYTVVIRTPDASMSDYYRYLSINPQAITPMRAFEISIENYQVSTSFFQEASAIMSLNHSTEKEEKRKALLYKVYNLPVSMERLNLLELLESSEQKDTHEPLNPQVIAEIELEIRKFRQQYGGEDLVVYADHLKWESPSLSLVKINKSYTWTFLSSSWHPITFTGNIKSLISWLQEKPSFKTWIKGTAESYAWNGLTYLETYQREIFWSSDSVHPDNWFNPNHLLSQSVTKDVQPSNWKAWGLTALVLGTIHFISQNRNKELVIQLN